MKVIRELDALPPNVLLELANDAIENCIDVDKYHQQVDLEDEHKTKLWSMGELD